MAENLRNTPIKGSWRQGHYSPDSDRSILHWRLGIILLMTVMLVIVVGFINFDGASFSSRGIWFITGASGLCIIWLIKQLLKVEWLAPPIVYAIILWMFHFGLLFPASISLDVLNTLSPWTIGWVDQPDTVLALLASLLFLTSFALGTICFYRDRRTLLRVSEEECTPELVRIGWILIGASLLLTFVAVSTSGWSVFLSGYQDFYEVHNSFSWPVIIMATGFMLQIAGGRNNWAILKTMIFLFVPLSLLVAIAGARTAPLFSTVAIVSILSLRGLRIPLKVLIPGVLLLLALTATVKDVRQHGIESIVRQGIGVEAQDPLTGLIELGGSLRPVSASFDYIRARGNLFYGETYLFPLIRQLERFTGTRGTVLTDERFIAARINQLYGSIGYSTVAEAFVNFGALGIILFAFAWGASLGWLTGRAITPYRMAVLAVVMIPMLINVRNSFIYVPAWILLGLLSIAAAHLLKNQQTSKSLRK